MNYKQILEAFHLVPNNRRQHAVWVEIWIDHEDVAVIDWNYRLAVRNFAAVADHALRNSLEVRTVPQ